MSNVNTIFAIARDTQDSCQSFDGSTWQLKTLNTCSQWKFIGGNTGKFIYHTKDLSNKFTDTVMSYDTSWHVGLLPRPLSNCIIATADGDDIPAMSYNGYTWTYPLPNTYCIELNALVCTKGPGTAFVSAVSWLHRTIIQTCIARPATYVTLTKTATFRRKLTAVPVSVVSWMTRLMNSDPDVPGSGKVC